MTKLLPGLRLVLAPVTFTRLHWVAVAAAALSVAGSALGQAGANKADKDAKDKAKHDEQLVRAATEAQVDSILANKEEAQNATVQRMSDIAREAAVQRGRIIAAAGVAGASPSKQLLESFYQEADARGREIYNLTAYKEQANRNIRAVEAGLQVNLPQAQQLAPSNGTAILAGALDALRIYDATRPRTEVQP